MSGEAWHLVIVGVGGVFTAGVAWGAVRNGIGGLHKALTAHVLEDQRQHEATAAQLTDHDRLLVEHRTLLRGASPTREMRDDDTAMLRLLERRRRGGR